MRLGQQQIEKICQMILDRLKERELITFKTDQQKIFKRLVEIFVTDLKVEDDLNKEVNEILDRYEKEMGKLDRQKMFLMIKKKLIEERKLVL